MTSLRLAMVGILCAISVAAASEEFEPVPPRPEGWGGPDPKQVLNGCPDVNGTFKQVPNVVEFDSKRGQSSLAAGKRGDFFGLFVHPRVLSMGIPKGEPLVTPVPPDPPIAIFQQPSAEMFEIITYSFDGKREYKSVFEKGKGDFICKDGFIEILFKKYEGYAEGRSYRISSIRRFTRMADGALLFYEQHSTWSREALFLPKVQSDTATCVSTNSTTKQKTKDEWMAVGGNG